MFAKDLTGCFSHCCAEGGDHWIKVCISIVHDGERCKLPTYRSLEGFQHFGIFQHSKVRLESCVFLACWFFSGEGRRSSSASCGHFQCLLLENFVIWHCSLLTGSASSQDCNHSGCGVVHGLCQVHLLDALWWPKVFANTGSFAAWFVRFIVLHNVSTVCWIISPATTKNSQVSMLKSTQHSWALFQAVAASAILMSAKLPLAHSLSHVLMVQCLACLLLFQSTRHHQYCDNSVNYLLNSSSFDSL